MNANFYIDKKINNMCFMYFKDNNIVENNMLSLISNNDGDILLVCYFLYKYRYIPWIFMGKTCFISMNMLNDTNICSDIKDTDIDEKKIFRLYKNDVVYDSYTDGDNINILNGNKIVNLDNYKKIEFDIVNIKRRPINIINNFWLHMDMSYNMKFKYGTYKKNDQNDSIYIKSVFLHGFLICILLVSISIFLRLLAILE